MLNLDAVLDVVMRVESSRAFWWIWGLSLVAYALRRRSPAVVIVALITATAVLATNLLEIEIIRPVFATLMRCRLGTFGWRGFDLCHTEIGIPSNHTARAAAAAAVVLWGCRTRAWKALALLAAAGVGFSRVYLGVHALSDVMWAVAIGGIVGSYYYMVLAPHART